MDMSEGHVGGTGMRWDSRGVDSCSTCCSYIHLLFTRLSRYGLTPEQLLDVDAQLEVVTRHSRGTGGEGGGGGEGIMMPIAGDGHRRPDVDIMGKGLLVRASPLGGSLDMGILGSSTKYHIIA